VRALERFVRETSFDRFTDRILFECASASGQSFLTPAFAADVAARVLHYHADCSFVLSSDIRVVTHDRHIIDGSRLPLRLNAELTKYCTLLVGCSSGISWLATSDWAKALPTIQVLRRETSVLASMRHDAEHFGLPVDHILEMTDCTPDHLASAMCAALESGFPVARARFHEQIPVRLDFYLRVFIFSLLKNLRFGAVVGSLRCVHSRYGLSPFLRYVRETLGRMVARVFRKQRSADG
jgi:hypothetical protein